MLYLTEVGGLYGLAMLDLATLKAASFSLSESSPGQSVER